MDDDIFGGLDLWATPGDYGLSAGPQTDGTWVTPPVATAVSPRDAGGGAPQNYTRDVLDLFKFGVSTYAADLKNQRQMNYATYQATNAGLFRTGQAATLFASPNGGIPPVVWIFGAVLAFVALKG